MARTIAQPFRYEKSPKGARILPLPPHISRKAAAEGGVITYALRRTASIVLSYRENATIAAPPRAPEAGLRDRPGGAGSAPGSWR